METLSSLQSGIASGRLSGCSSLKLCDGLSAFPSEIFSLADSLTFLNLSNNCIRHLPPEFAQLKKLEIVFFNNNHFETFPAVLADCPKLSMVSFKNNAIASIPPSALSPTLRWLILTNNKLASLPPTIGNLPKLQKLMLAGNQLTELPRSLAHCKNLELIRLSANQLPALPRWLFTLPRLSWLAYAGNPNCSIEPATLTQQPLQTISAAELQLGEILGQGASGIIYKAQWNAQWNDRWNAQWNDRWNRTQTNETVAVKIFKGEITSDGSPLDEMKACIAAGSHPNLVTVLGQYRDGEKTGLVFSFIPSDYTNLGNPPSLESCTRDTYSAEPSFSLKKVLNVAKGIASVACHLHSQGIIHGDLYAHNILIDAAGHSILGDFGAASFYDTAADKSLEKIEVRAFGCLLEDLLEYCLATGEATDKDIAEANVEKKAEANVERKDANDTQAIIASLYQLKTDCMNTDPTARPLFASIYQKLEYQKLEYQKLEYQKLENIST